MSEMKAPGPGRDFSGCPEACGMVLVKVAIGVVLARLVLRKVRRWR